MTNLKPELRIQPPRCTAAQDPTSGHVRKDCPACYAWDRWVQTVRWDAIRAGTYVSTRPRYEGPILKVRRCDEHNRNQAGCKKCNARARYEAALRRRAIAEGTFQPSVPAEVAQAHIKSLLDVETGGWFVHEIVAVSGMSIKTVQDIAAGARSGNVFADTWNAIKDLRPKGTPRARTSNMVDATEVRRTYQGLAAQGWTFEHMAGLMGRASKNAATRCATDTSPWVTRAAVEQARELRRKLGEWDLATLPEPMPGMHKKCVSLAAKKGWVPLSAWTSYTIANPNAKPYSFEPDDDAPADGLAFIDKMLRHRVAAVAQKLDEVADFMHNEDRRGYIDPIGGVTRLEAHAVVWLATELGMSAAEIAKLLGYPSATEKETKSAMRQVGRILANVRAARAWIDADPRGEVVPDWLNVSGINGRSELKMFLPALFAVQPGPFGPGWSLAEFAARCRVGESTARAYLEVATRRADRSWAPNVVKAARRSRRRARCSNPGQVARAA